MFKQIKNNFILGLFLLLLMASFVVEADKNEITIYSGRSQNLIVPVFDKFTEETGIKVNVRYGGTAELAATILEERRNSPADIFFAQDAGALGALLVADRLQTIKGEYLEQVDPRLRSKEDKWIGISGRARVVAYNTNYVEKEDLPETIWGFLDPKWWGKIGWAPTNGSFQAFVTALRILEGDTRAEEWLRGIIANRPRNYHNNTSTVDGVGRGEVHIGFVNHYYLFRFMAEQGEDYPVRHLYTQNDAGSMINIAGLGILDTASNLEAVNQFIEFLLTKEIQQYFIDGNAEYPVIEGMEFNNPFLVPLQEINTPDLDLSNLEDLEGTLELLLKVGAL